MKTTAIKGTIDFAIITIRDDEYRAVLQRFPTAEFFDGERRYSLSKITLPNGETRSVVVVRTSEQGEGEAQNVARDLIEDLDPDWLVLTGIACAVPSMDFTLGDVVLANRLHDFTIEAQREDLAVMRSGVRAPSAPPIQSTMNIHDVSALVPCPVS